MYKPHDRKNSQKAPILSAREINYIAKRCYEDFYFTPLNVSMLKKLCCSLYFARINSSEKQDLFTKYFDKNLKTSRKIHNRIG